MTLAPLLQHTQCNTQVRALTLALIIWFISRASNEGSRKFYNHGGEKSSGWKRLLALVKGPSLWLWKLREGSLRALFISAPPAAAAGQTRAECRVPLLHLGKHSARWHWQMSPEPRNNYQGALGRVKWTGGLQQPDNETVLVSIKVAG